jgi:hypothetical protein
MSLILKRANKKKRVFSVFDEDIKKQKRKVYFPHNYKRNHNGVLIFVGRAGRKQKQFPQLYQTEETE